MSLSHILTRSTQKGFVLPTLAIGVFGVFGFVVSVVVGFVMAVAVLAAAFLRAVFAGEVAAAVVVVLTAICRRVFPPLTPAGEAVVGCIMASELIIPPLVRCHKSGP
jgi:hypothetical protein